MDKLTTSDRLILGGGVLFFVSMFLQWYSYDDLGREFTANGWDYFLSGWLPLILIGVLAVHVAITRFSPDTKIPDLPIPWSQGYLIAGIAAAVIVFLRLIIPAEIEFAGFDTGVDFDRSYGIIVALLAAVLVAAGSFLKSKEDDALPPAGSGDTGSAPF